MRLKRRLEGAFFDELYDFTALGEVLFKSKG